jgi:alpha-mannosidase
MKRTMMTKETKVTTTFWNRLNLVDQYNAYRSMKTSHAMTARMDAVIGPNGV